MNAKNLPMKFAFVAVLAAVCLWSLYTEGCRQGIDLQGGYSLIFEIRTPEKEIENDKAQKAALEKELQAARAAGNSDEVERLKRMIAKIEEDIERKSAGMGEGNLSDRMINILKERIDPQGLANLEWRPVGQNRFEVRMPAGKEETRERRRAYEKARDELVEGNVTRAEQRRYLYGSPEQRKDILDDVTDLQAERLKALGEAFDAQQQAEKALGAARETGDAEKLRAARDAYDNARAETRAAELALQETNVLFSRLESILSNYRTPAEAEALQKEEREQLREQLAKDLAQIKADHPDRVEDIEPVVAAYKEWAEVRHRLSDAEDLRRRIARAGVLEFRIVAGYRGVQIPREKKQYYVDLLEKEGPEQVLRRGLEFAWFPIRSADREKLSGLVLEQYAGRWYALLSNQPGYRMVRERRVGGWTLTDAYRDHDSVGRPAIGFQFDEAGAQKFYNLTSSHKGKAMAILLDDEVFSAPEIQSAISDRGQITGTFTAEEIDETIRLLEAGSLPARLNPNPVAVKAFGPSLGAENRRKGIRAAYIGLICVAAFMLVYYLLAGAIADVALLLNIIFVLGTMSLLSAVFTLPGIAGVILTIGIAVDANVLIFERLREEQAKGQSVRMAVKNAYERAFSAIFDANITTLLTCLILGWVGTIEVRGFAVTLGLGVLFSLFTALIVTRWVFLLLLERNILKTPVKMLSIIGTPTINWMAKRKLFWCVSALLLVLGIASLWQQGSNILGIEFSSGTQAVLQFRDDALLGEEKALPNDEVVRRMFTDRAGEAGHESLRQPRVETLLDSDKAGRFLDNYDADEDGTVTLAEGKEAGLSEAWMTKVDADNDGALGGDELENLPPTQYQLSTTETTLELIQEVARNAFGGALSRRTKLSFKPAANKEVPPLGLALDARGAGRIRPMPDSPYRALLDEYEGGVAVVVEDVQPPITENELGQRIREVRAQEGQGPDAVPMRRSRAVGLGAPAEGGGFSSFAVLVDLEMVARARWSEAAAREAALVADALEREEAMIAQNFDKAISGLAAQRALVAIMLSWAAIVLYLWLRFGSIQWGLAAVICLVHDVVIVLGLVAMTGWLYDTFVGAALGLEAFKVDLAMVAAILTVIGYSVNDTIVVFDRIRENRGKLTTVSVPVINKSINQTLARTLLTSGTTFIVVFIMYVWGGQGIKAFNYALLVGIIFGTYSSVAIASPLLLGFKQAVLTKAAEAAPAA